MRANWQLNAGAIPPTVCDEIINQCKSTCQMQEATTFNGILEGVRKTKIGWTDDVKIKSLIERYSFEANRAVFNFDIQYIPPVQFGEYSEGGFYDWHHDVAWESDSMYDRKLSIVVQLTDPANYSGGEFEFKEIQKPEAFKKRGSVLVFPSYLLHRVTPITSGTRHSLVAWLEGPRWR